MSATRPRFRLGRAWLAFLAVFAAVAYLAAAIGGGNTRTDGRRFLHQLGPRIAATAAQVRTAEQTVADATGPSSLLAGATAAQQAAQAASGLSSALAGYTGTWASSRQVVFLEGAVSRMGVAMRRLVAATNAPNAAGTAASTVSAVEGANSRWDSAVRAVWSAAHAPGAPTV